MKKQYDFNPIKDNNRTLKYAFQFLLLKAQILFTRLINAKK